MRQNINLSISSHKEILATHITWIKYYLDQILLKFYGRGGKNRSVTILKQPYQYGPPCQVITLTYKVHGRNYNLKLKT